MDTVKTPGTGQLLAFAASRQGPGRQRNQDAFLNAHEHGFFVLADGIGGLDHGERASWAIVHALEAALPLPPDWHTRAARVEACLHTTNAAIFETGRSASPPYLMGTTLAAVLVGMHEATCFWAGDSRIYLLRDGDLSQVSADHSLLVAQDHARAPRAMLTRAVGVEAVLDMDIRHFVLKAGDCLLLCSDGVHGVLPHDVLTKLVGDETGDPASRIVSEAHKAGGRDDATAILVRITAPDAARAPPAPGGEGTDEGDALRRLERACWEIAHGNYADADRLFDITIAEDASPTLRQLAESVGFMLVQIEAREMRLTGLVDDLRAVQKQLEVANRQLAQENAELTVTVERLKVDIDRKEFHREVGEIVETEYFQQLQRRARDMRARHGAPKTGPKGAGEP